MSDFVMNSSWRDYLLGRVERAFEPQVRAVLKGRGDVSMVSMGRIAHDLFEDAYEVEANVAINDAGAQSRSTHQVNVETGLTVATVAFDVLSMVLPIKIMLPIGLARSLHSVFNAVEALNLGDRVGAAHYFVRSLGELMGALMDGAMGARGGVVGSKPRGLPAEMALGKKPEGVVPLAGWEGKGLYHKASKADGAQHYFLNDGEHWYSILDDGDKAAWRLRDARKLTQYHYAPIRQNASGRWEVGSHPVGGLKGGNPPVRQLMDLYPRLDEAQARRVFESFNFPAGRAVEYQVALVQTLRLKLSTAAFEPYLNVPLLRFEWRLDGIDLPDIPVEASVSVTQRPRPVEPQPGPSRPGPIPEAATVRPANEQFVEWGRAIDVAELEVMDATRKIYRRIAGDGQGQEYIESGQRYFAILPRTPSRPNEVFIRDPGRPAANFLDLEHLLHAGIFNQPRQAMFITGDGLWKISTDVPLKKAATLYVGEAFPLLTRASQLDVAVTLFNRANPTGLTQLGLNSVIRTLRDWQLWLREASMPLADPFSLLPRTQRSADNSLQLMNVLGRYHRLSFRPEPVAVPLFNALSSGIDGRLRTLMSEVVTRCRFDVLSGYSHFGELLFRRGTHPRLYWLRLRRVSGDRIAGDQVVSPDVNLMDVPTRNLVAQAQVSNNFVALMGGIQLTQPTASPQIFIIRV